jgi:hypothetical protein
MKPRSDDPADRVPGSPRPDIPIWVANLAPPVAALAHLQFSFVLEHTACSTQSKIGIHVITVVLLAIVIWAGLVARNEWRQLGAGDPKQLPGPLGSRKLMTLFGMIGAFIFGLFILAQWFPNLVLGVCVRT